MTQAYTHCQSCSMPLRNDPILHGTNADGTISEKFCLHCYHQGTFIQPDLTIEGMQFTIRRQLKTIGASMMAGWFTQQLPQLERWRIAG